MLTEVRERYYQIINPLCVDCGVSDVLFRHLEDGRLRCLTCSGKFRAGLETSKKGKHA